MLKNLREVNGRGAALSSVLFRKELTTKVESAQKPVNVVHRIQLNGTNLVEAFSHGNQARLKARVVKTDSHFYYRFRSSLITLDGKIIEE